MSFAPRIIFVGEKGFFIFSDGAETNLKTEKEKKK